MRRKRRRSNRLKRWTLRHPWLYRGIRFSLLASIWGAIVLGLAVIYFIASVPDPVIAALDDRPPNVTVLAEDGTVLAERGLRRGHVRLDVLPPYLVQAVLATEDRRFYSHFGVDPLGLVRATFRNASAGSVVEGGSTITQQLAKNLFLRPDRTVTRKLEEVVYAVWLEQRFSKKEILELYLNRVYFGGGTYGVEAASRRYFGKSSRFVTLPQAALLAGLLKAPVALLAAPQRQARQRPGATRCWRTWCRPATCRKNRRGWRACNRSSCRPKATIPAIPIRSTGWPSFFPSWSASMTAI